MFLQEKAVKKHLQKRLGLTPTELSLMSVDYYEEITQIILNETLLYLEKKQDQQTIDDLYASLSKVEGDPKVFVDKIENLYKNTPEIFEQVQDRIEELDTNLTDELVDNMTQEEKIEFLTNGVEELRELEQSIKKLQSEQKND